jgi:putative sigma-54 modulation protein
MELHLTARHFRAPSILQDYVRAKISKLERFYEGIVRCDVILTDEKTPKRSKKVEIKIKVYRSTLTSIVRSDGFSNGVVEAIEQLERQLVRYKSKLRERQKVQKPRTPLATSNR